MAKMYASDVAMQAAIEGVQIFGGYGYCKEYPAERHMRMPRYARSMKAPMKYSASSSPASSSAPDNAILNCKERGRCPSLLFSCQDDQTP